MDERLAKADILPELKQAAILNLADTTVGDLLFLVAVVGSAALAFIFMQTMVLQGSFRLSRLTIPSFFMVSYIVLMALPSMLWFYATSDSIRYTYVLAIQSVLVTVPLGVIVANVLFGGASLAAKRISYFYDVPLRRTPYDAPGTSLWLLMLLGSLLVIGVYIGTADYVPLLGAFTSYGEVSGVIVRHSIVAQGDLIHYGHALMARFLLPFGMLFTFFMAQVCKGSWRYWFVLTLLLTSFAALLTFDRIYPFSVMALMALAVYFNSQNTWLVWRLKAKLMRAARGRSKLRLGAVLCAVGFGAMLLGAVITRTQFNRPLDVEIIWETTGGFFFDRVLLDPSYMGFIYFDAFDSPDKFANGRALHPLVSVFGFRYVPTISPSFLGSLWINFGWTGVLFGSFAIGFALQFIQLEFFRNKSAASLSLYILLLLNAGWLMYGHVLATMVISVYVLGLLCLLLLRRRGRLRPGWSRAGGAEVAG